MAAPPSRSSSRGGRPVADQTLSPDEVLDAAADLFAERGFHTVRMRDIAERVAVRGPSLYHHFPSKADILYRIALDTTVEFCNANLPLLEADAKPPDRLKRFVRGHIEFFWHHRHKVAVSLHEYRWLDASRRDEINRLRSTYQSAPSSSASRRTPQQAGFGPSTPAWPPTPCWSP